MINDLTETERLAAQLMFRSIASTGLVHRSQSKTSCVNRALSPTKKVPDNDETTGIKLGLEDLQKMCINLGYHANEVDELAAAYMDKFDASQVCMYIGQELKRCNNKNK